MTTVSDIVTNALEITGIKSAYESTIQTAHANMGLRRINSILDGWNVDKLESYFIKTHELTLTAGKQDYTIGTGGDFNVDRPVRIESAYTTDVNSVVYPLKLIQFNEWDAISQKNIEADFPAFLYYNPVFPLGEIKFYPIPTRNYGVVLKVWYGFPAYTAITDTVTLPPGYENLLTYTLAARLCPSFGKIVPQQVKDDLFEIEDNVEAVNFALWLPTTIVDTPTSGYGATANRTFIDRGI